MADIQRSARAQWNGPLRGGSGKISSGSKVLNDLPYSVPSRFENAQGTNPEELLAAAHAGCFSMMLAKILGDNGKTPKEINTSAQLIMAQRGGGWKITRIQLSTEVSADGLDESALQQMARQAKEQCPVSVLLAPGLEEITLEARLRS